MKILYTCFGGAHSSVTAAAIHLGYLPNDRRPAQWEFYAVPFYDSMDKREIGKWVFMGTDEFGNDVYICGMEKYKDVVSNTLYSFLNTVNVSNKEVLIVNALVTLHPFTSIGGYLSRRWKMVTVGRPLTIVGIRFTYDYFIKLVAYVKAYESRVMNNA